MLVLSQRPPRQSFLGLSWWILRIDPGERIRLKRAKPRGSKFELHRRRAVTVEHRIDPDDCWIGLGGHRLAVPKLVQGTYRSKEGLFVAFEEKTRE
jgi:hypothetical protein